jgi:magnesium transporter
MVDTFVLENALTHIRELLKQGALRQAASELEAMHPADSAELLAELSEDEQQVIMEHMGVPDLANIFEQLDEDDMVKLAQNLDTGELADVLDEMEPDMAADLLGEMKTHEAAALLEEMEEPEDVARLMIYPENTAGGIMTSLPYVLRRQWTVAHAFDFLRRQYQEEEEALFYLYIVDRHHKLAGLVSLRRLIMAQPEQLIGDIMDQEVISAPVDADQEEVAQMLSRYDLLAVPIIDASNHLLGVVTVDDVVDVIEEEATEDIYRLAQVSAEAEIFSPIPQAIRNRMPWMVINLATAFLASAVVSLFENTIAQAAILAAFMPVVAGQGGNAGTQTLTIVVRSLALGELDMGDLFKALWHEIKVGIVHGVSLGLLVGAVAWLWQGNAMLGLVIGVAMLGNLIVAALSGVLVPMLLKAVKIDPALASAVFVTTATDVMGFFFFLGFASLVISALR